MHQTPDLWESGKPYELFMGRWSRPTAAHFLNWIAVLPNQTWLDIGCGTGALSTAILTSAAPAKVLAVDPSEGFIDHASRSITDPRITFKVGAANSLPAAADSFDVTVSGLVLNFIPEPIQALREMARVTRPGGVIAAYVWDYAGGMEMLRYFWDAAVALDPGASKLDEGVRFPICQPAELERSYLDAGLRQVELHSIEITSVFRDFEDYWLPFLGAQGPAPGYVAGLDSDQQAALAVELRTLLPVRSDGSIALLARAWAVKGTS